MIPSHERASRKKATPKPYFKGDAPFFRVAEGISGAIRPKYRKIVIISYHIMAKKSRRPIKSKLELRERSVVLLFLFFGKKSSFLHLIPVLISICKLYLLTNPSHSRQELSFLCVLPLFSQRTPSQNCRVILIYQISFFRFPFPGLFAVIFC